ncbi:MAG TPA: class I tRNA ligase family protein, partial [Candidatus Limnocylindrales bacterium]|nr:class I tRNA ligase family protein [Candidatus Limnocylindrales bacterium]
AKVTLSAESESSQRKQATWETLVWVLDRYLRLLHPVMPFVTERIWSTLPKQTDDPEMLIVARWPSSSDADADPRMAEGVGGLIELIGAMRTARAESGIAAADWLPARVWLADGAARDAYPSLEAAIARLARVRPSLVSHRNELDSDGEAGLAVVTATAEARLARSAADRERERERLAKELRNVEAQLAAAEARIADENFVKRAPANVVDQARARAAELRELAATLTARMEDS